MHRIDSEGHVGNRFTEGNPQTGQQATILGAKWHNTVQEELAHLVEFANIALSTGDDTQVRQAIVALIAGVVGTGGGSVPTTRQVLGGGLITGGGPLAADLTLTLLKASAAEVLAGVDDTKAVTPLSLANARPRSFGSNGYITLDGGFIIQWLRSTVGSNSNTNYSWPIAFPNVCLGAVVNGGRFDFGTEENGPFVSGDGTTTVSVHSALSTSAAITVIGIGY